MIATADRWSGFDICLTPEPDHQGTCRVTFTQVCRQHEHAPEGELCRGERTGYAAVVLVHLIGDEALLEFHEPAVSLSGLDRHDYEAKALELVLAQAEEAEG